MSATFEERDEDATGDAAQHEGAGIDSAVARAPGRSHDRARRVSAGPGLVHLLSRNAARVVLGLSCRVRAYGARNVPRRGGALLLSNHQSFLDPALIQVPAGRPLSFMARDTLFRNRMFAALIGSLSTFPVRRGTPDKSSIREAVDRLRRGEALVMFPEGTRSADGLVGAMTGGFMLLVRRAHVPVVPVALDGCYRAWPRSSRLPRPARLRVAFAPPIAPEEFAGLTDEESAERVRTEILRLLAGLRRLP